MPHRTWKETSVEFNISGELLALPEAQHDKKVRVKGPVDNGALVTYQSDGQAFKDYDGVEYRATGPTGQKIRLVYAGKSSYRFTIQENKIHYTGLNSTETVDVYIDGSLAKGYDLEPLTDPKRFTCTGDTLRSESEDGTSYTTLRREKE